MLGYVKRQCEAYILEWEGRGLGVEVIAKLMYKAYVVGKICSEVALIFSGRLK